MDNAQTQSMVAYENGPKEVNTKRGMPDGDKQFGKADKMSQDEKPASKGFIKKTLARHVKTMHRHKEHR